MLSGFRTAVHAAGDCSRSLARTIIVASKRRIALFPFAARAILAVLLGLSWQYGYWGPILSLVLIPLVVMGKNRRDRYGVALAYYLAGSHGLILGSASFFGPGHVPKGVALWFASSALLAAGWAFADRPWRVIAVLVVDALPPLGLFDWLSPLAGAGVLFPGMGVYGVALLLVVWGLWSVPRWGKWIAVGSLAVALVANVIVFYTPFPTIPSGWVGLQTHTGELVTPLQGVESAMHAGQMALAHPKAAVVVFPETIVGHWLPGTQAALFNEYQQRQNKAQIWLIGAVAYGKTHRWDSVVEYAPGLGHADVRQHGHIVSRTAFPVPVSMWAPWAKDRYGATWYEPVQKIGGMRVFTSICYDQLLSWVWLEAVWQRPDIIIATSNVWWAAKTDIPAIEDENTAAWARLMWAGVVMARNG